MADYIQEREFVWQYPYGLVPLVTRTEHNPLSAKIDSLRELLLEIAEGTADPRKVERVRKQQIRHRKDDLNRLKKLGEETFTPLQWQRIQTADPNLPLRPQLKFNPDKF